MSSFSIPQELTARAPLGLIQPIESSWFAIQTIARHEKRVSQRLQENNVVTFLPLLEQNHQWTDRRVKVDVPLFNCYVFVQIDPSADERVRVLRTPGVVGLVGSQGRGAPIPDEQMESLQAAIRGKLLIRARPLASIGQRVRIRGGALDGVHGCLVRSGKDESLVISVELLQRSVEVRFEGYQVEPA